MIADNCDAVAQARLGVGLDETHWSFRRNSDDFFGLQGKLHMGGHALAKVSNADSVTLYFSCKHRLIGWAVREIRR